MEDENTGEDDVMNNMDEPYLKPIEEPEDPIMKQIYAAQKATFGKVLTPLKVHSARLPSEFAKFYGQVGELDKDLKLSAETAVLIRRRVAQINDSAFAIDINRAYAIMGSVDQTRFDLLEEYETNGRFTDAERSALDYASELTTTKKVGRETFAILAEYYAEREICEITYLVASENLRNLTDNGLNINSDMLSESFEKKKPHLQDLASRDKYSDK